jgi:O-antigen/teichoic acid export membrane protein
MMKNRIIRSARGRIMGWGVADQIFSSGTNFGLIVLAAHRLGPGGLGLTTLGFSTYVIWLALQRSLVTEPLVVLSVRPSGEIGVSSGTPAALTSTIVFGALGVVACAFGALAVGGSAGKAILLFAPWLIPALVQDLWRSILFRDGRGAAATANDATWLLIMMVTAPIVWVSSSAWEVVACWGLGATGGAFLGFVQLRAGPASLRCGWRWIRAEAWNVSRWFLAHEVAYTTASQSSIFLFAALLGSAALGGLRAVQSVFAPLTLLAPALALPGLPMLTREVARGWRQGRTLAWKLSGFLVAVTSVYLLALGSARIGILAAVFGSSFRKYAVLVLPVGIQQIFSAAGEGFALLLKAARRGRALFWTRATSIPLSLAAILIGHSLGGIVLVVWCLAVARGCWLLLMCLTCYVKNPLEDRS